MSLESNPPPSSMGTESSSIPVVAKAIVAPKSRSSSLLWWVIPILATITSVGLFAQSYLASGLLITIELQDGHGVKPEDRLRHKGIDVGVVEEVELSKDLQKVEVRIRLASHASDLAREGSKFWVVRPVVTLESIGGLETILGAKYVAVQPGPHDAPMSTHFVGLNDPPGPISKPGSLEILLDGPQRHGLSVNAPILYRGYRIGNVIQIGLASDARSVRARCAIEPDYRDLIRTNTKFWNRSGWKLNVGISGIEFDGETLPQMLTGSIETATPDTTGEIVKTGHLFQLHDKADSDWTAWQPSLGFGEKWSERIAQTAPPMRVAVRWQERLFGIRRDRQRLGWCVPMSDGTALCLGSIATLPKGALQNTGLIEFAGMSIPAIDLQTVVPATSSNEGAVPNVVLLQLPSDFASKFPTWPLQSIERTPAGTEPRGIVVVQERMNASIRIDASRLTLKDGDWQLNKDVEVDSEMDGLPAIDAETNQLLGFLSTNELPHRIVLLRE